MKFSDEIDLEIDQMSKQIGESLCKIWEVEPLNRSEKGLEAVLVRILDYANFHDRINEITQKLFTEAVRRSSDGQDKAIAFQYLSLALALHKPAYMPHLKNCSTDVEGVKSKTKTLSIEEEAILNDAIEKAVSLYHAHRPKQKTSSNSLKGKVKTSPEH